MFSLIGDAQLQRGIGFGHFATYSLWPSFHGCTFNPEEERQTRMLATSRFCILGKALNTGMRFCCVVILCEG